MSTRMSQFAKLLRAAAGIQLTFLAPLAAQSPVPDTVREVTVPFSREHSLASRINGREYRILVALPFSYRNDTEDTTRYPVFYLLDGNMELPMFASMFRLTNRGKAGDVILVGVGYPPSTTPGTPPPGSGQIPYRQRDYTPPAYPASPAANAELQQQSPRSGGAPLFHRVMKEEIIPFVESRYRTTSDRGIHGHSFGGLFATYILFEDPDLFTRYAITSPSLEWDHYSMFVREAEFAKRNPSLRKTVYLSVGTNEGPEMIGVMWRLAAALCDGFWSKQRYQGLEVITSMNVDEYHQSAVPFARALAALYPSGLPGRTGPVAPAVRTCGVGVAP
jgi:predicted alpha/beta superfamily hydrolase